MAEVKYESKITSSAASAADIFRVISDFRNLDKVKDLIPQDKVQEVSFTEDTVRMKVDGLGQKICIKIVDKEENKTVKYGAENIPIDAHFWIQLKEVAQGDTRLRLTFKGDIPVMFKMMIGSKLQKGLDDAADMLANMPFSQWT